MNELHTHLKQAVTLMEDRFGILYTVDINLHLLEVLDGLDRLDRMHQLLAAALPPDEIAAEEQRAA